MPGRIKLRILMPASLCYMAVSLGWALLHYPNPWYLLLNGVILAFFIHQYISEMKVRAAERAQQHRSEQRIRHMAYYDDLTGLPNRRQFRERLSEQLESSVIQRDGLAVFYMDIDRFKLVNDSLGHDFGDILLLHVAERLTRVVGPQDFVARMEGDEFALFFLSTGNQEKAFEIATSILNILDSPFLLQDYQIHLTASIGIALYDEERAARAEDLMRGADVALSRAKEGGKNTYQLFTDLMNQRSMERLQLEQDLRQAMARGEFSLHYQPQVHAVTGEVIGFEALLRWTHPERGRISPDQFIPIVEENGMIDAIGDWVIQEACRQNKAWQDEGYPKVPVSVNVSTKQFQQSGLAARIQFILHEVGLDPCYLGLELTESVMMNQEQAYECLKSMKELGVHISIDDFGTGYCSLSYLKRLPIDKLKIDRSFVNDVLVDPNDAAIVATIIAMARHLNLRVIAEGVETEEQKQYLLRQDCHEVQGYVYSPALTADEVLLVWGTIKEVAAGPEE